MGRPLAASTFVPALCGLFLVSGCGSAPAHGTATPFQSGLDPSRTNTPASALTGNELALICQNRDQNVQDNLGFDRLPYINCLALSILVGGNEEGCRINMDRCLIQAPASVDLNPRLSDERACMDALHRCTADAKAVENCIGANVELAFEVLHHWSCSQAEQAAARDDAAAFVNEGHICTLGSGACQTVVDIKNL